MLTSRRKTNNWNSTFQRNSEETKSDSLERIDFLGNVSAESLSLHPTVGISVVSYLLLHLLLFLFDLHYQCHFAVKPQDSTG